MNIPLTVSNDLPQPNFYQMNEYRQVTTRTNSLQIMFSLPGIQVQEQFQKKSTFSFGQQRERYFNIFPTNFCGQPALQMPLFTSIKTHVPERFCGGDLPPLLVFVQKSQQPNLQQIPYGPIQDGFFLKLERKWRCSQCCFNRSPLDVIYIENGQNVLLGQIEVPYAILHQTCNIYDRNNNLKYNITQRLFGESTKLSFFPWDERESQLFFDIKDSRGQIVSQMRKQTKSKFNYDVSVNFSLIFPQNSIPEEKALLLAAILMFECMYF
ncbi:unnamed protein product (macronuclear) [Paramecium tetraurelia]|uniref:Phospholipid scramblase n=1 Tax=Paramecium tetraurelia TaxID=5888 RepID=A0C8P2_PARTE|nr:uncharacterized protein GSPATT00036294001 [Paramecium tetraurelia]CAK67159.1 unnamed protein product [Paramecium tetraurelia]|eukprot:XP_001434556.1 hypothetical protein (macronuclear) [Paramecium tetraurelia strain d4-2]